MPFRLGVRSTGGPSLCSVLNTPSPCCRSLFAHLLFGSIHYTARLLAVSVRRTATGTSTMPILQHFICTSSALSTFASHHTFGTYGRFSELFQARRTGRQSCFSFYCRLSDGQLLRFESEYADLMAFGAAFLGLLLFVVVTCPSFSSLKLLGIEKLYFCLSASEAGTCVFKRGEMTTTIDKNLFVDAAAYDEHVRSEATSHYIIGTVNSSLP